MSTTNTTQPITRSEHITALLNASQLALLNASQLTRVDLSMAERVMPRFDRHNVRWAQIGRAVQAKDVQAGDLVISRYGSVTRVSRVVPEAESGLAISLGASRWLVEPTRLVPVVVQTECGKCGGTGDLVSAFDVRTCYGCDGRGWCNREDIRRNYRYHLRGGMF